MECTNVPLKPVPRNKSLNLNHLLFDREAGIDRRYHYHRRSPKDYCIDFFKCIPPNLTICNVEKPLNFLRKFSPDGKYLICFSRDQQSCECYRFLGTTNACAMLYDWKTEYIPPDCNTDLGRGIRENIFDRLFQLHWSIQLTSSFLRPLYREFSVYTEDGQFIVIASHMPIQEEHIPSYYTLNSINRMHFEYDLFWYRFYMIRLSNGAVTDIVEFPYDYIRLSHNHGIALRGNLMVIVSLFHQTINILKLQDGKFIKVRILGRYPHGTDDCICKHVPEYDKCCQTPDAGENGLKQKILIFLYRKVLDFEDDQRTEMLKLFYQRLYIYEAMQLYKLQFVDEDHLLIRYDLHKHPNVNTTVLHKLFVVYNIVTDEIVRVSAENSADLLIYFILFCDYFRDARCKFTGRAPSSSSNSLFIRAAQVRIINAFPRGYVDAAYRLLPQIPLSVQSYSVSPYLDLSIFNYDTQLVSNLERPKYSNFRPIRFYDRETKLLLFRMYLGIFEPDNADNQTRPKELSAFVIHPMEPFFISVQKLGNKYVTNFHIRNEGTVTKR